MLLQLAYYKLTFFVVTSIKALLTEYLQKVRDYGTSNDFFEIDHFLRLKNIIFQSYFAQLCFYIF